MALPVVWTALYADLALTAAVTIERLEENGHRSKASFRRSLGVNLVLNCGWSAIFWRARRFDLATLEAAALTFSSAKLALRVAEADRRLGLTLGPYAAWCGFATALTAAVWRRNGPTPR